MKLSFCLAVILAVLVPSVFAGDAPPAKLAFEKLVPADASIFIRVDVAALRKAVDATPLKTLKAEPDVKAFWEDMKKVLDTNLAKGLAESGTEFKPQDFEWLFQGEMAVAVGNLEKFDKDASGKRKIPAVIVLVDAGPKSDALASFLKKAVTSCVEKERMRKTEEDFRGTVVTWLEETEETRKKNKADEKAKKPAPADPENPDSAEAGSDGNDKNPFADLTGFGFVRLGSAVVVSSNKESLRQVILASKGDASAGGLAGAESYRRLRDNVGAGAPVMGYVNVGRIIKPALVMAQENAGPAAMIAPMILNFTGLNSLEAVAFGYQFTPDGVVSKIRLEQAGAKKGLLWNLFGTSATVTYPGFIPEDAQAFSILQVDPSGIWTGLQDVIAGTMGAGMGGDEGQPAINPTAMFEAQFGVNFKKDLFDALGSEVVFYQKKTVPPSPSAGGGMPALASPNFNVTVRLKDPDTLKRFIGTIQAKVNEMNPGGWPFEEKEYMGRVLHQLKGGVAGRGVAEGEKSSSGFTFTVTDGLLILAASDENAKEMIRRFGKEGKSVTDTEGFKSVAKLLPSEAGLVSYTSREYLVQNLDMVKQVIAIVLNTGMAPPEVAGLLAKFPDPKLLSRELGAQVTYSAVDPQGVTITGVQTFAKKK
ncbi:MAG: hypothetical protein V1809_04630 [Planctomycetota bacterium]